MQIPCRTLSMHWADSRYVGLDTETDHVLEIAVLITDGELNAPHLEASHPDYVLNPHHRYNTRIVLQLPAKSNPLCHVFLILEYSKVRLYIFASNYSSIYNMAIYELAICLLWHSSLFCVDTIFFLVCILLLGLNPPVVPKISCTLWKTKLASMVAGLILLSLGLEMHTLHNFSLRSSKQWDWVPSKRLSLNNLDNLGNLVLLFISSLVALHIHAQETKSCYLLPNAGW